MILSIEDKKVLRRRIEDQLRKKERFLDKVINLAVFFNFIKHKDITEAPTCNI